MAINQVPPLGRVSETMSRMGRGGDDTLVHMSGPEVRGLASLGKLSYNPVTGLPEAFAFLPILASMAAAGAGWGIPATAAAVGGAGLLSNKMETGEWDFGKAALGAMVNVAGQQLTKGFMSDDFMTGLTNIDTPLRDVLVPQFGEGPPGHFSDLDDVESVYGSSLKEGLGRSKDALPSWLERAGSSLSKAVGPATISPLAATGAIAGGLSGLGATIVTDEPEELPALVPSQRAPTSFAQQVYERPLTGASEEDIASGLATYYEPGGYGLYPVAEGGSLDKAYEGYVGGEGHGMEDNQMFKIKGGGLAALSPKEYVVPADVMASMGNGNPDEGAKAMDSFISKIRKTKYGRDKQPPEMNARKQLQTLA